MIDTIHISYLNAFDWKWVGLLTVDTAKRVINDANRPRPMDDKPTHLMKWHSSNWFCTNAICGGYDLDISCACACMCVCFCSNGWSQRRRRHLHVFRTINTLETVKYYCIPINVVDLFSICLAVVSFQPAHSHVCRRLISNLQGANTICVRW